MNYSVNCGYANVIVTPTLELYRNVTGVMGPSVGLAIQLMAPDEQGVPEPFQCISVCFGEHISIKNAFYADVNNAPWARQLLEQGFARETPFTKQSGFCTYPLWILSDQAIEAIKQDPISAKNYKAYEKAFQKQLGM